MRATKTSAEHHGYVWRGVVWCGVVVSWMSCEEVHLRILLADLGFHRFLARLTLHMATPLEATVAALGDAYPLAFVAAAAAHEVAASGVARVTIALSTTRSERAQDWVGLAKVRRFLCVEQVVLGRSLELSVASNESRSLTIEGNFDGGIVAVPESVSCLPKRGQLVPTGSDVARPGHSVALATYLDELVHSLQKRREYRVMEILIDKLQIK